MEEGGKEAEQAKTQPNRPEEEVEKKAGGEKEQVERQISEGRDIKEEVLKMSKEPSRKAAVSSFFGEAAFALPSAVTEARGSVFTCAAS